MINTIQKYYQKQKQLYQKNKTNIKVGISSIILFSLIKTSIHFSLDAINHAPPQNIESTITLPDSNYIENNQHNYQNSEFNFNNMNFYFPNSNPTLKKEQEQINQIN